MVERSTYGTGLYGVDLYSYNPFVYFDASSSIAVTSQPVSFGLYANFFSNTVLQCSINSPALTIVKDIAVGAVSVNVNPNDVVMGRLISYNAVDRVLSSITASMLRVQSLQATAAPLHLGAVAALQLLKEMAAAGGVQSSVNVPKLDVLRGFSASYTNINPSLTVGELLRYRGFYANGSIKGSIWASLDVSVVRYFEASEHMFVEATATFGRLRPFGVGDTKLSCLVKLANLYAGSFWLDDIPENSGWSAIDALSTIWVNDTPTEGGWR